MKCASTGKRLRLGGTPSLGMRPEPTGIEFTQRVTIEFRGTHRRAHIYFKGRADKVQKPSVIVPDIVPCLTLTTSKLNSFIHTRIMTSTFPFPPIMLRRVRVLATARFSGAMTIRTKP